jgi:N-acetylglucosaminyl-diphospho-decaprenol L-rhamnosyltransferase
MPESNKFSESRNLRVTVVIVSYKSVATIGAALGALRDAQLAGLARVIVVDNASDDGTADYISRSFPSVEVVRNADNVGFGRGCNQGIALAKTPYILLLNPDAAIDAKSITVLTDFLDRNPRVGICGPSVIDASGALQPAGGLPKPWKVFLNPLFSKLANRGIRLVAPGEAPRATDSICGSIMLLRKEMIDGIGIFDPRFFLYFEETDLCLRAGKAGWEIWTVGEAVGKHVNAASTKQTKAEMVHDTISEHYYRSRYYYLLKHFGLPAAVLAEIGELGSLAAKSIIDSIRGRPQASVGARLRAPILRRPALPNHHVD